MARWKDDREPAFFLPPQPAEKSVLPHPLIDEVMDFEIPTSLIWNSKRNELYMTQEELAANSVAFEFATLNPLADTRGQRLWSFEDIRNGYLKIISVDEYLKQLPRKFPYNVVKKKVIWDLFNTFPRNGNFSFNSSWTISDPPRFDAETPMWDSSLDEIAVFKPETYFSIWSGVYHSAPIFRYSDAFRSTAIKVAFRTDTLTPLFDPLALDANGQPLTAWDIDHPPTGSWGVDPSLVQVLDLAEYIALLPAKYIAINPLLEPYWPLFSRGQQKDFEQEGGWTLSSPPKDGDRLLFRPEDDVIAISLLNYLRV